MKTPRIRGLLKVLPRMRHDGVRSWLVSGTFQGKRVQIQRLDKSEAEKIALEHNLKIIESSKVNRPVVTSLSHERVVDAERAAAILPGWATLTEAAQFFAAHYRPVLPRKWSDVLVSYLARLRSEAKNAAVTVDTLEWILNAFARDWEIETTDQITRETVKGWVFAEKIGSRTQRDRYDHMNRLCKWLLTEKAIFANPLENVPRPKVTTEPPTILTVPQIQRLLDCAWIDPAGPALLPYFALCVLGGARPLEVRRAEEGHFFLDDGHPIFEVWRSKTPWHTLELTYAAADAPKPKKKAEHGAGGPLLPLLREFRNRGFNIVGWRKGITVRWPKKQFDRVRLAAGVFDCWDNDIMRHSFASYHYALHHDIRWLEANLSTSERVLFDHYIRRTVRRSEAEAFGKIRVNFGAPRRSYAMAAVA